MKILIDINHAAHIHYFKNFSRIMIEKGHSVLFVVRDRENTLALIKSSGFDYVNKGRGASGLLGKLLKMPSVDYRLYRIAKEYGADLFISYASPYACVVSTILRKPCIALDDTEHAKFEHIMCRPLSDVTLSPYCYRARLWRGQQVFDSFLEMLYLHPNYYIPDEAAPGKLGLAPGQKYCILRFVAWDANHDVGQHGLSAGEKKSLVKELSAYCRVFISSESELDEELLPYRLDIHPSEFHDILYHSSLYIGEGSTTASEAALMGVPSIYVNSLEVGYVDTEVEAGLAFHLHDYESVLKTAVGILSSPGAKDRFMQNRKQLLEKTIDPTAFLVWYVENWPRSRRMMKDNPDVQYNFR